MAENSAGTSPAFDQSAMPSDHTRLSRSRLPATISSRRRSIENGPSTVPPTARCQSPVDMTLPRQDPFGIIAFSRCVYQYRVSSPLYYDR